MGREEGRERKNEREEGGEGRRREEEREEGGEGRRREEGREEGGEGGSKKKAREGGCHSHKDIILLLSSHVLWWRSQIFRVLSWLPVT